MARAGNPPFAVEDWLAVPVRARLAAEQESVAANIRATTLKIRTNMGCIRFLYRIAPGLSPKIYTNWLFAPKRLNPSILSPMKTPPSDRVAKTHLPFCVSDPP
jgi:hypothetical protein